MNQHSVGNRIAVNLESLNLPVPKETALEILKKRNIYPVEVDIVQLAREVTSKAKWKLPSRQWEAPYAFDCSSLTKWLFGQKGIWIPRRSLQQLQFCREEGSLHDLKEAAVGDLIFVSSPYKDGVKTDNVQDAGHVFIKVDDEHAICATNSELGTGVVELPISTILATRRFNVAGRVIPSLKDVQTLIFPPEREVETVDDIRHIITQAL
jgi:hypothetical protein